MGEENIRLGEKRERLEAKCKALENKVVLLNKLYIGHDKLIRRTRRPLLSAAAHKKLGFGASCGACTEHPACISSLAQPHRLLAIASHNGGEVAGVSNGAFNSTNALATAKCPCPSVTPVSTL